MRHLKTKVWACVIVLAGLPATAETLSDVLVSAYNNSNLLDQSRAVLRAADEDVAVAVSALRPVFAYEGARSYSYVNQVNTTVINTLELTLQMSLFEFGRNRLSVEATKQAVLAARESLRQQEQDVLFAAVQGYTAVRQAQAFIDLRRNNVRVLSEEVRAARDRFEVGEVTRTDVAQAEAAQAEAEANLVSAEGDLETAREAFKLAVGRYPGTLAPPPAFPTVPGSLGEARGIAVSNHPSIKQAQFTVAAQDYNVEIAERELLPTVSVTGSWGYSDTPSISSQGNMEDVGSVGLSVSGPIYQGGRINALYRQAVAQRDQNRANLLQTSLNIEERVGFAWANLEVARASLSATERQIDAQEIAFEGTREEATLGARTTLDVLNAEQDLLDARGLRIQALTTEQDAYYFLLQTMGLLTADKLGLDVVAYDAEAYYNAVRTAPPVFTSEQGIKLDRVLKGIGKE